MQVQESVPPRWDLPPASAYCGAMANPAVLSRGAWIQLELEAQLRNRLEQAIPSVVARQPSLRPSSGQSGLRDRLAAIQARGIAS